MLLRTWSSSRWQSKTSIHLCCGGGLPSLRWLQYTHDAQRLEGGQQFSRVGRDESKLCPTDVTKFGCWNNQIPLSFNESRALVELGLWSVCPLSLLWIDHLAADWDRRHVLSECDGRYCYQRQLITWDTQHPVIRDAHTQLEQYIDQVLAVCVRNHQQSQVHCDVCLLRVAVFDRIWDTLPTACLHW